MNTLRGLPRQALRTLAVSLGAPAYRGDQIFEWLHRHRVTTWPAMTNLSGALRDQLAEAYTLASPEIVTNRVSVDGTCKLVLRLGDGGLIECVLIPTEKRLTLCVSTQIGCPLACTFCATGTMGFKRNLEPSEIVDQVLIAESYAEEKGLGPRTDAPSNITNMVFMGMGEPLLNIRGITEAVEILKDPGGLGWAPRRITLSTVGIGDRVWPVLERTGVRLALSLHAPNAVLREQIMPIERAHPVEALLTELRRRQGRGEFRDRVTFEYVLLAGVNDQRVHAKQLVQWIDGIDCKVNLLAFNPFDGTAYKRPSDQAVALFQRVLRDGGLDVYVRRSRGRDVAAACGQLALAKQPSGASVSRGPDAMEGGRYE